MGPRLLPRWTEDLRENGETPIDARAETVGTCGVSRRLRAAPVPGAGGCVYEWEATEGGKRHPFAIARHDGQPMAFAGLWEGYRWLDGTVLRTFAIITPPHERRGHHRGFTAVLLVILDQPELAWLGEADGDRRSPASPSAQTGGCDLASRPAR